MLQAISRISEPAITLRSRYWHPRCCLSRLLHDARFSASSCTPLSFVHFAAIFARHAQDLPAARWKFTTTLRVMLRNGLKEFEFARHAVASVRDRWCLRNDRLPVCAARCSIRLHDLWPRSNNDRFCDPFWRGGRFRNFAIADTPALRQQSLYACSRPFRRGARLPSCGFFSAVDRSAGSAPRCAIRAFAAGTGFAHIHGRGETIA